MPTKTIIVHPILILLIGVCLTPFSSCTKSLTQKNIVYQNDFNNGELKGFAIYSTAGQINDPKIEAFNGSNVFGRFFNNYIFIKLDALPKHFAISVEFDLYIHDKWEGDSARQVSNKPDLWVMAFDDNPVMITTFSNTSTFQSYPSFYLSAHAVAPRVNADRTDLPGACSLKDVKGGTSLYKIVRTVEHSAGSFKFAINDNLNVIGSPDTQLCTKSWSIDNLKITTIQD